ncbi:hypothetical protein L2E82_00617 [Cichorium intybus]|uniref:Uncharacterized protein n=1 Tax=Cichorium intybus TaxID=13427 RepID=A0ACB9GZ80_CICIN|nr:hypothetical protein L2E82_00617 [Cichorium intybus]
MSKVLLSNPCCKSSQGHFNKHPALFVFGDSLFDPGNNNYLNTTTNVKANFWPYGESYFHPPSGRFSNGRIIPDFIAEFVGLPLIPAYLDPHNNEFLYGVNFASAGSTVSPENQQEAVVDLKTQLRFFTDLVKHYRQNLVIGNFTDVLKGVYEQGGRKFGIGTLTSLGCLLPIRAERLGNTCDEQLNILASLHDKALSKKLQDLAQQWEGFMYAKYELQNEITKRMINPSKYGTLEFHCFNVANYHQSSFEFEWMCRFQGGRRVCMLWCWSFSSD